jgi:hypothetical protein
MKDIEERTVDIMFTPPRGQGRKEVIYYTPTFFLWNIKFIKDPD